MSFVKDAIFGSKGTPSQAVDLTPEAFERLRSPLAGQLLNRARAGPQQFPGLFSAPLAPGEQQGIQNVQQAAGNVGQTGPAQLMLAGAAGMNPFAGLSGLEQSAQQQVMQQAFGGNPLLEGAQGFLGQQLGAQQGGSPLGGTLNEQLQLIAGGGPNPMVDRLIESASRPILEQFSDEQLAQRGAFTAAGQQVQGQGSSPFAQASARLSSGVADALGDVGTQIAAQEQQRQLQALGLAQQNQFGAAQLADQISSNALTRGVTGLGAAGLGQERQGQAFESQQQRQLQAGGQLGQQQLQGQVAQMQAQLENLQAQGLPRLVQQLGIDAGLQEFQRQQQEMLQLMQLMGGIASPTATVLPGTSGTPGALQSFAGGLGQGFGTELSDRRLKRDIQPIAEINGVKVYRFKHEWSDRERVGVMADEVAHIPGAVMVDDITGLATVDYAAVNDYLYRSAA